MYMYVYVCIHIHSYIYWYICMYIVRILWFILYVYRSYIVCIYTYTRICTYILYGKLLVGLIRAYTDIRTIYIAYTSHIHLVYIQIHTTYIQFVLEPVFFVYVFWCPYMHVYAVYWRIFGCIRTVTKKYVRSRYMHVHVRIHMYMHVCLILATRTG